MSTVLVYATKADVRQRVLAALGRRPAPDLDEIEFVEATDAAEVIAAVDHGEADLCIFDAEAAPSGGMGLSRQLKNEVAGCPPTLLLIARRDDRWLASWSQADAVVGHPIDPGELTDAVVGLLRGRLGGVTVRRPVVNARQR